ncbi:MAG: S8 family serine peptidase [Fidelibacterota bacterium]
MKKFLILFLSISVLVMANSDFTLLPRLTEQTRPFFDQYPNYDGKKVTIFVMDTGVEISLPGLDKNPDGSVKVVDVYDAARSGDIDWIEPEFRDIDGTTFMTNNDDIFLKDYKDFNLEDKKVYLGIIKEEAFQNSVAKDINGNGKTDDAWGFITFQESEDNWAVVMDTDMDGSLQGETIVHNYDEKHESIMLPRKNPLSNHQWMALTVKIYPGRKVTNFHFEDGAHGTHVAGIAAGYHINGDPDVNGLAPAANVVSIKISDGKLFGSATNTGSKKRGLEYVSQYMKEHGGYGVINISFGIESSNEGFSDIDNIFNEFAINNPNVIVCTSAGNEGPGLSSIGTPSSAQHIIASGASMYYKTGRDKYGWTLEETKILQFSSRGGECTKPDVISPGAELSTVPRWETNDFYWGTSMASPYTAGEIAAVLSGLAAEYPDRMASAALVQHGLRETSTFMDGYTYLDQGNGKVDMLKLFKWLKGEIEEPAPVHFNISTETFTPSLPQKKSNSIYWRISDINDVPEDIKLKIKPEFNDKVLRKDIDGFFAKYTVKSDNRWAKPRNRKISLLRDLGETVTIKLDTDDFEENEMRVGKIKFTPDGNYQNIGQEVFVTAINPIRFTEANNFTYRAAGQQVTPGHQNRYFLALPFGSSAMTIKVNADNSDYAKLQTYILDNHGLPAGRLGPISSDGERLETEKTIRGLEHGVYELVVLGDPSGKKASSYDVEVFFEGVEFCEEEKKNLTFSNGNAPGFSGKLTPVLDTYKDIALSGEINGYGKKEIVSFGETDTITHSFEKTETDKAVAFKIDMPLKYHTNFTDIMITAENSDGKQLRMSGIGTKDNTFYIPSSVPAGKYTLKILPAYADYVKREKFDLDMEEVHYFNEKYTGAESFPENTLFQNENYSYTVKLNAAPPLIPDDYYYFGNVKIIQRGKTLAEKIIRAEK